MLCRLLFEYSFVPSPGRFKLRARLSHFLAPRPPPCYGARTAFPNKPMFGPSAPTPPPVEPVPELIQTAATRKDFPRPDPDHPGGAMGVPTTQSIFCSCFSALFSATAQVGALRTPSFPVVSGSTSPIPFYSIPAPFEATFSRRPGRLVAIPSRTFPPLGAPTMRPCTMSLPTFF